MTKTTLLLASLTGLFIAVGYMLGGQSGMVMAFGFAMIMNVGSYFFSDKLVLSMHHAKAISKQTHQDLYLMVEELVTRAALPMPKLYLYQDPIPNAFATGRDPEHAVVAVSSGILQLLSKNELRGVLAHELGHVKNRDMLISTVAATLAGAISMLAQMAYGFGGMMMNRGDSDEERGNPAGALIIVLIAPLAAGLVQMAVSRNREFEADETGARLVGDTKGLSGALAKLGDVAKHVRGTPSPTQLATSHLYISNPFKLEGLTSLFSTHPPLSERIARLSKLRV